MEMKHLNVGVWIYGVATVVTGILNLVWGEFEASHQPMKSLGQHIPGEHVLAYISSIWLVTAGTAILWRRTARIGAVGSALIYMIFALFWLPRYGALTHQFGVRIGVVLFVLGGIAQQLLLAAPAAIVYATTGSPDSAWRERAVIAARWMLGLSPIAFGLGHLINAQAYRTLCPALGAVRQSFG